MDISKARRVWTGIDRLTLFRGGQWVSGGGQWVARSRLLLPAPDRVEESDAPWSRSAVKRKIDELTVGAVPARAIAGHVVPWNPPTIPGASDRPVPVALVSPAVAVGGSRHEPVLWHPVVVPIREHSFVGLTELCDDAELRVLPHRLAVSWWRDDFLLALALGVARRPVWPARSSDAVRLG